MQERLRPRGLIHVRPNQHPSSRPVGDAVRAAQRFGVRDRTHREAFRLDQRLHPIQQAHRGGADQQQRGGRGRKLGSVGLRHVEDVHHPETDHPPSVRPLDHGLVGDTAGRAAGIGTDAHPARRQDRVAPLASHHVAAQALPGPEPGDHRRLRGGHPALEERRPVGSLDQEQVTERVAVQPRLQPQEALPVLPRDQPADLAGQHLLRRSNPHGSLLTASLHPDLLRAPWGAALAGASTPTVTQTRDRGRRPGALSTELPEPK